MDQESRISFFEEGSYFQGLENMLFCNDNSGFESTNGVDKQQINCSHTDFADEFLEKKRESFPM